MISAEISCCIVTVAGWLLLIAAIVITICLVLEVLELVVTHLCEITAVGMEFAAFVHQRAEQRRKSATPTPSTPPSVSAATTSTKRDGWEDGESDAPDPPR